MTNIIVSAAVQILVVLILAFLVWLIFGRKKSGFLGYVGLHGAPLGVVALGIVLGIVTSVGLLNIPSIHELAGGENSVVASVTDLPASVAIVAIVILAVFKTAFAEELLFRGLIGKRLVGAFGFYVGNTIQAILFGAVHLLVALSPHATTAAVATIVGVTTVTAWVNGLLNEKSAHGSILPGWAAHAAANLTSYLALWLNG